MQIERELFSKIREVIDSPEAIIITGMRRVGKTTLLHYIKNFIDSNNKLFIDLENPANQLIFEEKNYDAILDNFKFLGLNTQLKGFVFLDEIQLVKNIPSIVKYLSDHYPIKFFMTGSASFYLKNLFTESLAGRKHIFELFPLSFREYLKVKGVSFNIEAIGNRVTENIFETINPYYKEFIRFGAFPGVVAKETIEEKRLALEDIFTSYFQLEVKQIGDFKKNNVVRNLLLLLMERIGSKLDIQKISKQLGVARPTIYNYIEFLESTYFIKKIRPFSRNKDSEIRSTPKLYFCDSGLLNHFTKISEGALFENAIFNQLNLLGEINYYQRKSGVEIDFILNKCKTFEVKIRPYDQDLQRLKTLTADLKMDDYSVVSGAYYDMPHILYGFLL